MSSETVQTYDDVAKCDICDERPGVRLIWMYGIQTWACARCSGDEEEA